MKKHIIGLTLFSGIVTMTAVAYALFNVPEIVPVAAPQYVSAEGTHCKMRRNADYSNVEALVVTQAVFDLKTKQINWELAIPSTGSNDTRIALHFFVKDKNGTRYLNSVLAPLAAYENGVMKATSSYEWLDNLSSYESLYVMADYVSGREARGYISFETLGNRRLQPKFNAEKATSVLLYSGEQGYLTEKYFRDAKE